MNLPHIARSFGGVATYHEEDRGDEHAGGGGGGEEHKTPPEGDEAAKAAAADKAKREAGITVPKARFDEAVAKERKAKEEAEKRARAAEERAAARDGSKEIAEVEKEIDGLYEELDKAIADNDPAEKKRIRGEIRAREQAIADAKSEAASGNARELAVEQVRYDAVVDRAEVDYPFLRSPTEEEPNEEFNEEMLGAVLALKQGYEVQGAASSAALKRAIRTLKPQLDALKKAEKSGDEDAAAKAAKDAEEAAAALAAGGDRRAAAVAKGAAAAKAQPAAKTGDAGTADKNIKKIEIKGMSDKDFDALPEAEKKRLRGD